MHGALAGPDSRALPRRPTSPRPDRSASAPSHPRALSTPLLTHTGHLRASTPVSHTAAALFPLTETVINVQRAGHAGGKRTTPARDAASRPRPTHRLAIMRDEPCSKMFDMSIQEVNGKGPKKRKKSLETICDSEGRERAETSSVQGEENAGGAETMVAVATAARVPGPAAGVRLLHWRDMPRHLQFNPYVLTGYRPLQSWSGCVRSLFYFHNETINILTHGVSLVYMMMVLPGLLPWGGGGSWFLSLCHLLGAMAPWCGSFLYHLFMNHDRGEALYHRLLQLDMLGIWVSQSIGAIPMVTATVYCAPALLRYGALAVYCLGSLLGLYKAMRAWSPWERRLCFAAPFCMRLLLAGARAARVGGGDPHAILHVFLQDAVSLGGGVIGAMHIPEKWFPGTVDRCLNSHNIMHVLVVLAVYSMHQVTTRDLEWMSRVDCHAPLRHL